MQDWFPTDALLVDIDVPWAVERVRLIEEAHRRGTPVFLYPHGGGYPISVYDGLAVPHPHVAAMLVTGPGHVELEDRIGHKRPVREIGWYLCDQQPLVAQEPKNVLFAPIHPWAGADFILPTHQAMNKMAYQRCLDTGLPVTVRVLGSPETNGVWSHENATLTRGDPQPSSAIAQIDAHDLIVAQGTFAMLALARGKHVVMTGQDLVPTNDEGTKTVGNWDSYHDLIRYPLDVTDGPLLQLAARGEETQEWRQRFVGEQATAASVTAALAEFTPRPRPGAKGRKQSLSRR